MATYISGTFMQNVIKKINSTNNTNYTKADIKNMTFDTKYVIVETENNSYRVYYINI